MIEWARLAEEAIIARKRRETVAILKPVSPFLSLTGVTVGLVAEAGAAGAGVVGAPMTGAGLA